MTALILLAAGLSERFGTENKLLADLIGKPILQHVMEAAKEIKYTHRIAVISESEGIKKICKSNGYDVLLNSAPKKGQGHSIVLGARHALELGETSICIMLGDMPFISSAHLEKLLDRRLKSDCIFSLSGGVRLPPAIFSGDALKQLSSLKSEQGAKAIFSSAQCLEIALPEREAQDIDTRNALQKLENM